MELIIESLNTKLYKKNSIFLVEKDSITTKIPTANLERIILNKGVNVTTNALVFALESNIDVIFVNDFNEVIGKLSNEKFGSTTKIRRNQYFIFSNEKGAEIGKYLLLKKLNSFNEYLKIIKGKKNITISKNIENLEFLKGNPNDIREAIMGFEGNSSNIFYREINELLPLKYQFSKREHQNAKEPFNILLNYCFGVLYRICEGELIKTGLDPYVGIFHTDDYNKKSFLFDFIEAFRFYGIETVIDFIKKKYIRETHFYNGSLTKEGKEAILQYFKKQLLDTELYDEKNYKREEIIRQEALKITKLLKEEV